ncbi:MAG: gamma-glutamyltransferase [Epsilonproteobacteria bacterium]|nr:gamma-glutamyltransferase [Campylobacterota bacterium]
MIACLLAAPLCEPILTSLAGGGFMLAVTPQKEPIIYDFFVDVPFYDNKKEPEFYPIEVDFGTTVQEFHIGCGSIAVPGVVKGIWKIYEDLASLPFETLIQPALNYATKGIYLSKTQSDFLKLLEPIFLSTPDSKKLYTYDDKLIDSSHLFTNYEYADFLKEFAKQGERLFYEGEIASKIESLCQKHHGFINKKELSDYQVKLRKPIKIDYKNHTVFTNPPPSSGGILIAFSLLLLKNEKLNELYLPKLIESQEITGLFRHRYVNEFLHSNDLEKILLDKKLISNFIDKFHKKVNLWGNTTHISIIDKDGNAASTTTTNGEGSGYIVPECGIMLNNMLGEEDLNPHGFFKWESGIRLPSMMSPTAVFKDKKLSLLLGSAGSNRIRSAILQVILNYIEFNMPIQEAISSPRVHFERNTIFCEPGINLELNENIKRIYDLKKFDELNLFFGGVQAVTGDFEGGADPRRGASVIYQS